MLKILAPLAFIAMVGMYGYWFYTDFLKKKLEQKKAAKIKKLNSTDLNSESSEK